MHVLSVIIGAAISNIIPETFIKILLIALFLGFGFHLLYGPAKKYFFGGKNKGDKDETSSSSSSDSEFYQAKEQAQQINELKEPLLGDNH
jgi:putative Ca2+/H+ antiporter (TMEM165/GDT1 family)